MSKFFGDNKMAVNRLLLFYVQLFRFRAVGKSEYLKGKVSSNPRPFKEQVFLLILLKLAGGWEGGMPPAPLASSGPLGSPGFQGPPWAPWPPGSDGPSKCPVINSAAEIVMSVFNQTTKSNATTAQSFSSFMASYPFGLVPYGTSGKNSKSFQ